MALTSFVALEAGSEWPAYLRGAVDAVRLTGGLRHFEEHVHQHWGETARRRSSVDLAVLACNCETRDEAMLRRVAAGGAILKAIVRSGRGQLVLAASPAASRLLRQALLGLAEAFNATLEGACARVCVSLGSRFLGQRSSAPAPLRALAWCPPGAGDGESTDPRVALTEALG
jgi:hypothetical protein